MSTKHVKGKRHPVQAYQVFEETGTRTSETSRTLPFKGLDAELKNGSIADPDLPGGFVDISGLTMFNAPENSFTATALYSQPMDWGTGAIFRRWKALVVAADDETWFHKTIVAQGPHMAVWVNGMQVSDWTDERATNENARDGLRVKPGTIMIQGHDPTTNLSFRNLRAAKIAK